jgi:hypothetical protein
MPKIIVFILLIISTENSFSQIDWFSDDFDRPGFGSNWITNNSEWVLENGTVRIETKNYDHLLSSSYYVYNTTPYSFEVRLRGIRAGIYFSLDDRTSKNLSHMVRFDERSILTGYFNANGVYTATNVFEIPEIPKDWTTLRVDVDPVRKQYEIFLNGKSMGTDQNLIFSSGYIGLQASEGISEFKYIKIYSKQKPIVPAKPKKDSPISFQHVSYVKTLGRNLMIYNPELGYLQTVDSNGNLIHQKIWDRESPRRTVIKNYLTYSIKNKKIFIENQKSLKIDSILDRLVAPSSLLIDKSSTLFIADPGANAIIKFDSNGRFLKSFNAISIGGFKAPRGIDFFDDNKIVIADFDKLVIVDKDLNEITPNIESQSSTEVKISWPCAVGKISAIEYAADGEKWKKQNAKVLNERNYVTLRNLQPLTRYSFKVSPVLRVIPSDKSQSREFRFTTAPKEKSMMSYTRLPVMYMVYRTISYRDKYPKNKFPQIPDGRTIADEEIEYLKNATKFNREFYFRNSSCRFVLDFDFYVIEDTLWLHEVGDQDPYWLSANERVTKDYEKAVRHFGKKPEYYAGLICPYAWVNYPQRRRSAMSNPKKYDSINIRQAYGGGTMGVPAPWKYGKTSGYTGNPFQDKFSRQDWLITHEFHHQIDALMDVSGYPEYYHADMPWIMPGRFGEDFDFNAAIIRNANYSWWLNLKFGSLEQTKDADKDGVPDDDPSLPFDEKRLGGSPDSKDTDNDGLSDLDEVMAGTSRGTLLNIKDTDGDGLIDGKDPYPIYPINYIIEKSEFNQQISWRDFGKINTNNLNADIKIAWDDNNLYIGYESNKPANMLFQIDANSDGWFHGFDNFQMRIFNYGDSTKVEEYYLRDCSSWSDSPLDRKDILNPKDLKIYSKIKDEKDIGNKKYSLYICIQKNVKYGLELKSGKKMSVRLGLQTTLDRWIWEELFERNYMMEIELR